MATRSPKENLQQPKKRGGRRKIVENNPKEKLAVNCTKVQPTAKCSTSRYARPHKTSAPHLINSIRYVSQYFLGQPSCHRGN
jgi:hypothetical protein